MDRARLRRRAPEGPGALLSLLLVVALASIAAGCGAATAPALGLPTAPTAAASESAAPGREPATGRSPVSALGSGQAASTTAASPIDGQSGLPTVAFAELPPEARATIELIRAGGPFPYSQDGAVFGNRERLLPPRPAGWYREYTVETPGSDDRGARRLVAGADGTLYWTEDHYASFRAVRE